MKTDMQTKVQADVVPVDSDHEQQAEDRAAPVPAKETAIPLRIKFIAVILVSLIGFGSHWSSGVTGAMKSTIKKVNPQSLNHSITQIPQDSHTRTPPNKYSHRLFRNSTSIMPSMPS